MKLFVAAVFIGGTLILALGVRQTFWGRTADEELEGLPILIIGGVILFVAVANLCLFGFASLP